jgi:hypothetical protein
MPTPRVQRADLRTAARLQRFTSCQRCRRHAVPRFCVSGNVYCSDCFLTLREREAERQ